MERVGRNDPCPCGSGKKYKNCHMDKEEHKKSSNKSFTYLLLFILIIVVGVVAYLSNQDPEASAPPGQVWSEEHQHYH